MLCSLVDRYKHFGGTYGFHLLSSARILKTEARGSSVTLVDLIITFQKTVIFITCHLFLRKITKKKKQSTFRLSIRTQLYLKSGQILQQSLGDQHSNELVNCKHRGKPCKIPVGIIYKLVTRSRNASTSTTKLAT
jgi:hypothetical protein